MSDNVLPLRLPVLEAARRLFSHVVAVHEYRDATGALVYARARRTTAPKVLPMHRTDAGEWVRGEPQWPGRKKMLYRLDAIASSNGPVWIVEGEKCADVLTRLGLTATTSGSSSSATLLFLRFSTRHQKNALPLLKTRSRPGITSLNHFKNF